MFGVYTPGRYTGLSGYPLYGRGGRAHMAARPAESWSRHFPNHSRAQHIPHTTHTTHGDLRMHAQKTQHTVQTQTRVREDHNHTHTRTRRARTAHSHGKPHTTNAVTDNNQRSITKHAHRIHAVRMHRHTGTTHTDELTNSQNPQTHEHNCVGITQPGCDPARTHQRK